MVVLVQENRSFDSYFGTYPGADGIPMAGGVATVCLPDPLRMVCTAPYHDASDVNAGGPHGVVGAIRDIAGGEMNGFIASSERSCPLTPNKPACQIPGEMEVMGYHDAREIPNYWAYANSFVLQDHVLLAPRTGRRALGGRGDDEPCTCVPE